MIQDKMPQIISTQWRSNKHQGLKFVRQQIVFIQKLCSVFITLIVNDSIKKYLRKFQMSRNLKNDFVFFVTKEFLLAKLTTS